MQDHSTIIQQSPLNFSHKEAHVSNTTPTQEGTSRLSMNSTKK